MSVFGVRQRQIEDVYAAIAFGRLTFVPRQRDSCCRVIVPLSAVCYRILVVCVSPGDLSGDAPKILRSGTRTVCRVRDECSLRNFCMCFSWDLSGDAPKILRSGTRSMPRSR